VSPGSVSGKFIGCGFKAKRVIGEIKSEFISLLCGEAQSKGMEGAGPGTCPVNGQLSDLCFHPVAQVSGSRLGKAQTEDIVRRDPLIDEGSESGSEAGTLPGSGTSKATPEALSGPDHRLLLLIERDRLGDRFLTGHGGGLQTGTIQR
jgi:hypothetical protein